MRLLHELNYWRDYSFLTLTYSEDSLPVVGGPFDSRGTLCRRDFTLFIKRLRKLIAPRKLKYYACGEYGKTTLRPHYHAILFGVSDSRVIEKAWSKGFVKVLPVSVETFRYVTSYIDKGDSWSRQKLYYNSYGLEVPFKAQSTRLGRDYAIQHEHSLRRKLFLTLNGITYGLPRYYRKVLGITQDDYFDLVRRMNEDVFLYYLSRFPKLFDPSPLNSFSGILDVSHYRPFAEIARAELRQKAEILHKKFTDAGVKRLK